ncbi:MAG: hypothetical protein QOD32_3315 [Pyrinomonadaceae bacterium]|jgi:hypothetical protein|nr:hypothetical protein [Pyrinomonadaceae bacterium]
MPVARWFLAITALLVFILVVPPTVRRYFTTPGLSVRQYGVVSRNFSEQKITIPDKPYNDLTDGGIQAKLSLSTNLFQIALLVTAALAGLLIAKDNVAGFVLGEAPELIMFGCAGLLLMLSFVSHFIYLNEVSYLYFLAGKLHEATSPSMPDISDSNVNFLFVYQFQYLVSGVLLAAFTFLSAHVLKRR